MQSKKIIVLAISLTLSFGGLVSVAYANHSWGDYHWARTTNPFMLKIGNNVSSAWVPYLNEAISDWSVSPILDLTKVTGSTSPRNCKPKAGQIEVCSERYGKTGWLGIAQIWVSGSHITKAITKVNDTYFKTSTYNKPAWRRLVMCQELAHDFGLNHQDEVFGNTNLGSCMDYTSDPDGTLANPDQLTNEHANTHDFDQIETIYTHLDSTNTFASLVTSARGSLNAVNSQLRSRLEDLDQDIDLDNPAEWGGAVRRDARGRNTLHVRDLGRGEKVFTFVTWVQ
ncbi:MAG: hypothetical protein Q7K26_00810 [bacterium]|nr:hypothetical protein [bacterium]